MRYKLKCLVSSLLSLLIILPDCQCKLALHNKRQHREKTALLLGSSLKLCKWFQVNDTVMLDLETGKVKDFIKFDIGQLCMATGGHNRGRVGTIVHKEKHKGSFDIVLVRDSAGQEFATRYPLPSSPPSIPWLDMSSFTLSLPTLSLFSYV